MTKPNNKVEGAFQNGHPFIFCRYYDKIREKSRLARRTSLFALHLPKIIAKVGVVFNDIK